MIAITAAARDLFLTFAEESADWDGTPPVDADVYDTRLDALCELEAAGLLTVFVDGGNYDSTVQFTTAGVEYADRAGVDLSHAPTCD